MLGSGFEFVVAYVVTISIVGFGVLVLFVED